MLQRASGTDSYQVRCVTLTGNPYGRPILNIGEYWTDLRWMKPDNPAWRPDLNVARGMAQEAARNRPRPAPRPQADGAATSLKLGAYQCWAHGAARQNLNFTVTGGSYRMASGSGAISLNGATKGISFSSPMAAATRGYTPIYREPGGRPTVSFRNAQGDEVAFREKP